MHKLSAAHFFLYAGYTVLVYVVLWAATFLYFGIVDAHFFPGDRRLFFLFEGDFFAWVLSVLVVGSIPLIVIGRLLRRKLADDPALKEHWIRSWSVGLTLFLAGVIVLSALAGLLYRYLQAETFTAAFALKASGALLLYAAVFWYFWEDYRHAWLTKQKLRQVALAVWFGLVAVMVLWSLWAMGAPADRLTLKYDLRRVDDLVALEGDVQQFYIQHKRLPESTRELEEKLWGNMLPADPETNEPYRYERIDEKTYRLCATFAEPFPAVPEHFNAKTAGYDSWQLRDLVQQKKRWDHPAGEYCFERTVTESGPKAYPEPIPAFLHD